MLGITIITFYPTANVNNVTATIQQTLEAAYKEHLHEHGDHTLHHTGQVSGDHTPHAGHSDATTSADDQTQHSGHAPDSHQGPDSQSDHQADHNQHAPQPPDQTHEIPNTQLHDHQMSSDQAVEEAEGDHDDHTQREMPAQETSDTQQEMMTLHHIYQLLNRLWP